MALKNNSQAQYFAVTDPKAKSVRLAGDFTQWQAQAIPRQIPNPYGSTDSVRCGA